MLNACIMKDMLWWNLDYLNIGYPNNHKAIVYFVNLCLNSDEATARNPIVTL